MTMLIIKDEFRAFAASSDAPAVVECLEGNVEYSSQTSGPFQAEGTIAAGKKQTFEQPTVLLSHGGKVDVTYPESDAHLPELPDEPPPPPSTLVGGWKEGDGPYGEPGELPPPHHRTVTESEMRGGGVTAAQRMQKGPKQ